LQLKTSSCEEGCDRNWLINTKKKFIIMIKEGELVGLKTVEVAWK
jgi:glutamate synthase (NADPH/NADH) small chain